MNAQARTRVGIIGAGNIATIAQLPTLVKRDDVELAALVSRRPDHGPLMRRWGFRAAYGTVEDMLSAENLDAVFVLTPRSEHAHAVEACLRRDVDVFCEKPLAPSADEAERLADLADQQGRLLMVDFNRRYAPVYVAGRQTFGSAGATFCVAQKNRPGSEYRATFENAIHMVDLLRWYCGGDPVDVTAHSAGEDPWQEDGTAAIIGFDTGNTGVLMAARTAGAWNEKTRRLRRRAYRRSAGARIGLDHRRRRHHHPQPQLRGLWMGNGDRNPRLRRSRTPLPRPHRRPPATLDQRARRRRHATTARPHPQGRRTPSPRTRRPPMGKPRHERGPTATVAPQLV